MLIVPPTWQFVSAGALIGALDDGPLIWIETCEPGWKPLALTFTDPPRGTLFGWTNAAGLRQVGGLLGPLTVKDAAPELPCESYAQTW